VAGGVFVNRNGFAGTESVRIDAEDLLCLQSPGHLEARLSARIRRDDEDHAAIGGFRARRGGEGDLETRRSLERREASQRNRAQQTSGKEFSGTHHGVII